ncbi:AcrR family transcriptional regulator [Dyadobacter sp. BE34]|uniref:AcrR family transcriptional regulator n=1 Tax=Dyadobacter fermentans TaxID=94254 RepID=A0ABU1R6E8_9BACT|nr:MULTISPECIES: TetR/AcrR family transcriptional regulator [Dyadobacter]MDR6808980.1 AcrR family transcriptional regulator [Dyadobacter fermentans]MDR7046723.1 AcrR family transcriptional regulator [Dyadobacter sp. BE242]MDR7201037.1 AcrR family transcriptional regulator [Dyadobacter sp. BE34]MDR7218997.1 AcrR family transcriptional regulator [Dyadobacter sp. BE31]MDR7264793.1 AcrR family transcriptional regulator [Dyadobacter sp. BE32]
MAKAKKAELDLSTEEKIKEAASIVFTKKGYGNARTRDIAEEAGINLALLNYYFRSKEKLFQIVMAERIDKLFGVLGPVLNDESTTLEEKLEKITESYINMLLEHPDLPIFVLSEIRNNPEQLSNRFQARKHLTESVFIKQLMTRRSDINPFHFLMNLLGMNLFPFVAKPVLQPILGNEEMYRQLMEQRKKLVPAWMKLILDQG